MTKRPRLRAATTALLAVVGLFASVPALAGQVVVGPGNVDGVLRLDPPSQGTVDGVATWTLHNGGERRLRFSLSLHEVLVGADGRATAGDAMGRPPPADTVVLEGGEQARIVASLEAGAMALRAETAGSAPLEAVAVAAGEGHATPTVDLDGSKGRATIRLAAEEPTVAAVAVAVNGWPGRQIGSDTVTVVVIPPGVTIAADIAGAIGPTAVDVAVTSFSGASASARAEAFVITRTAVAAVAAAAVVVAALAVVTALRRRRRPPGPDFISGETHA